MIDSFHHFLCLFDLKSCMSLNFFFCITPSLFNWYFQFRMMFWCICSTTSQFIHFQYQSCPLFILLYRVSYIIRGLCLDRNDIVRGPLGTRLELDGLLFLR
eukprot:994943_1